MRAALLVILVALPAAGSPDADGYFEIGLDYLKKGFYAHARAAFAESLLLAPGEPVPTVFLGVATCGERRSAATCATLFRLGYRRLPRGKSLRLDLGLLLPSKRALALIHRDYSRRLEKAGKRARRDLLSVLAFLEVHDGDPGEAPSLDALLEESREDAYALALAGSRTTAS